VIRVHVTRVHVTRVHLVTAWPEIVSTSVE